MKFTSDNFTVTPTPLEYVAGEVPATISANIPAKVMKKKAIVTCTPVLRWEGGEAVGSSATLQGEKVEANNQIISYKNGGHATLRTVFPFQEAMSASDLYMTFNAKKGNKTIKIPDVKIGYGTNCTAALVHRTVADANKAIAPDNFQRVISQKQAATIKFLIGQANLRGSELNSSNIKDFINTLRNIKSDEQSLVLNNVDVSAYASPDGGYNFNERLAERRGNVSESYVKEQLKKTKLDTNVDMKYTAEDWEGFQELVSQSNLQDKDLILRVLSMYQDPEQREREIRNVATVYTELATAVLPELRRARMTINYDVIGRSDEQIMNVYQSEPSLLSVEELLYASQLLADNDAQREAMLKKTIDIYPNDYRAYNNLAALAMQKGDNDTAQNFLRQSLAHNSSAPEANVNLGLMALEAGNVKDAEVYLAKGTGANNINEALGNLYIAQGKYSNASLLLEKIPTNSTLLSQILSQDYALAKKTSAAIQNADATTNYLRALLGARMNDEALITKSLADVAKVDPSFARHALSDLEFSNYKSLISALLK
jgi:Flp pilus assembly protein TadD